MKKLLFFMKYILFLGVLVANEKGFQVSSERVAFLSLGLLQTNLSYHALHTGIAYLPEAQLFVRGALRIARDETISGSVVTTANAAAVGATVITAGSFAAGLWAAHSAYKNLSAAWHYDENPKKEEKETVSRVAQKKVLISK